MTYPMMQRILQKLKRVTSYCVVIGVVLGLAACGIKPGQLAPPSGEQAPQFPGTYPQD